MIELRNVSKSFRVQGGRRLLRDYLAQRKANTRNSKFWALRDVSSSVDPGESLALIGRNRAGKSTTLTLISGLTTPDSGTVRVLGRMSPILQLGAGFHTDLTGRENLYLNAAILGLHRKDVIRLFDSIVDYAGNGEFIEQPLRTYSSGMMLRRLRHRDTYRAGSAAGTRYSRSAMLLSATNVAVRLRGSSGMPPASCS